MAGAAGIKAGRAFITIGAIDKTGRVLKRIGARMNQFANRMAAVGRTLLTGALGAAVPVALATRVFLSFDDAMRRVEARSGATAAQMEVLRDQVKFLGRTTSFTASQVANLQEILARRGFTTAEIEAATPNILNLARAAGDGQDAMLDITNAATLTARAMSAFGINTSKSEEVANLFTTAANNSALSMSTLLDSLKFVAPIAKAGDISLKKTVQTLGELADIGIEGSMAGTVLRRMFIQLIKKGGDLRKLGVDFEAAGGGFRPLQDIIDDVDKATDKFSKVKKLEVFERIFGTRAIAGASGLSRRSDRLKQALDNLGGSASRTSKLMDAGLGGVLRRLLSAIEGVAIAIGESLEKALTASGETITSIAGKITVWIEKNGEVIVTVLKIIAAVAILGTGMIAAAVAMSLLATALGLVGTAFSVAGAAAGIFWAIVTSPISLIAVAITGLIALMANMAGVFDGMGKSFVDIGKDISTTFGGIFKAIKAGKLKLAWKILVVGLKLTWFKFVNILLTSWERFVISFESIWRPTLLAFEGVWFTIKNLVQGVVKVIIGAFGFARKVVIQLAKAAATVLGFIPGFGAVSAALNVTISILERTEKAEKKILVAEQARLKVIEKIREEQQRLNDLAQEAPQAIQADAETKFTEAGEVKKRLLARGLDPKFLEQEQEAINAIGFALVFEGDTLERIFLRTATEIANARKEAEALKRATDAIVPPPTKEERLKTINEEIKGLEKTLELSDLKNKRDEIAARMAGEFKAPQVGARTLQEGLQRGTIAAAKAAFENEQTNLLAEVVNVAEKQLIEAKILNKRIAVLELEGV